jgi:predicted NBD/HSP70 family sugar kinase
MYLGIDVGATKVLFAVFDETGKVVYEHKIPTKPKYEEFLADMEVASRNELVSYRFKAVCCALPGWFDFRNHIMMAGGNIPWHNVRIKQDLQHVFVGIPVFYHNDTKLAGLSEAVLLQGKYNKVLYVTISTGISGGVIISEIIDPEFNNYEPGQKNYRFNGQEMKWEAFASGKALFERYGKMASEINDPAIWQEYVKLLVPGFVDMLNTVKPEVVVIGGGVGTHFDKFKAFLETELKKVITPPPLLKAQRPEEAVIYGCYDYIKQNLQYVNQ